FAGLGWCHAARRAVEQAYAELLFQKLDALAQRRSLDAQLFRRPGEIALLRHRDEGRDLVEVICAHRPKLAMNSGDCSHKLQCSEPGAAAAAGLFIIIVLRPTTTNSPVSAKNTSANAIVRPSRCVIRNNCLSAIILASGP